MKKILLLALGVALLGGSCNRDNQNQEPVNETPAGTLSYTNQEFGFAVDYPKTFSPVEATYGNLTRQVYQIQADGEALAPNTNLGDAAFTVSTQPASSQDECLESGQLNLQADGQAPFMDTLNANGTVFYLARTTGAGAGNLYESRLGRVFRGGTCLEVTQTVHTTNLGNYPEGTVEQVDLDPVWAELDRILYTFRFLQ